MSVGRNTQILKVDHFVFDEMFRIQIASNVPECHKTILEENISTSILKNTIVLLSYFHSIKMLKFKIHTLKAFWLIYSILTNQRVSKKCSIILLSSCKRSKLEMKIKINGMPLGPNCQRITFFSCPWTATIRGNMANGDLRSSWQYGFLNKHLNQSVTLQHHQGSNHPNRIRWFWSCPQSKKQWKDDWPFVLPNMFH